MIELSESLANKLNGVLNKDSDNRLFDKDELLLIKDISLSKNDLEFIDFFSNVESLELCSFPSVDNEDMQFIINKLNKLKSLKIKEQNALFKLNVDNLKSLEELCLIHNDNIIEISGLVSIKRFTFYDNKDFNDVSQIIDLLLSNKEATITLDISYYIDIVVELYKRSIDPSVLLRFTWVECIGLRKYHIYQYTNAEIDTMLNVVSTIVSKYVYSTDGDIEKFGVLYDWMIKNIRFVNEDNPNVENANLFSNINRVFNYSKGGRLSYAKAFQILLSFAGIKSSIVYSLGAIDDIGVYNGQKIYSLLGESDYAVLRVTLEGMDYYCDVAWDSLVYESDYYDKLRLFLFSKNELKIRHKFVGEANITNTHSYRGDDCDDLIMYADDRLKEVEETFDDIERLKPSIDGMSLNIAISKFRMRELKTELENLDENTKEYNSVVDEMSALEELLDSDENELRKLEKSRNNIVKNYSKILLDRYFHIYDGNVIEALELLERLKGINLISEYMCDLLTICIKETA